MPPRIAQASRFTFRWLSAADDDVEVNTHPATTPICGWLVTDALDQSLLVYDSDGGMLGTILSEPDPDKPAHARWDPAPGGKGALTPEDFVNIHLTRIVNHVLSQGADFVDAMTASLETALDQIFPETTAGKGSVTLLLGRPLAVVRATVGLELKGLPAVDQNWREFLDAEHSADSGISAGKRDTAGFEAVQFPVRLGDHTQITDGLAGYWRENSSGGFDADAVFQSIVREADGVIQDPNIRFNDNPASILNLNLTGSATNVTLLVEPHAAIHASSGILPVKELTIPPELFTPALQNIEVTFRSGPIITPGIQVRMPLSVEPGYDWSWIQKERIGWSEVSTRGLIEKPSIVQAFEQGDLLWQRMVDQNWLQLLDPVQAAIVPRDQRKKDATGQTSLGPEFDGILDALEILLGSFQIGAVDTRPVFLPQGVRDGWLMLTSAPKIQPLPPTGGGDGPPVS
jgi:hypothetical protein